MFGLEATYITQKYEDSGHGWLAVERGMLRTLGIERSITACSYQKGGTVYLEEDIDAVIFMKAMEKRGMKVEYNTVHTDGDSKIRDYERYQP